MLRHRAEQVVVHRRAREEAVFQTQKRVEEDRNFQYQIELLNKSSAKAQIARSLAAKAEERMQNLETRREKLRCLFRREEQCLLAELDACQETLEERTYKLAERARELREAKERERREFVESKLMQKLMLNNPEFRKAESEMDRIETLKVQQSQIAEAGQKLHAISQEGKIFEALVQKQFADLVTREESEARARVARNEEVKLALAQQTEQKRVVEERVRAAEKLAAEKEREKLEQLAALDLRERQTKKREARERVVTNVAEERRMKERTAAKERELNDQIVAETLAKEKVRVQEELEAKQRQTLDMQNFLREEQRAKQDRAVCEKELETLLAMESEKHWESRYAAWARQEQARQQLLQEVYAERAAQVREKLARMEAARVGQMEVGQTDSQLPVGLPSKTNELRSCLDRQVAEKQALRNAEIELERATDEKQRKAEARDRDRLRAALGKGVL